MFHLGDRYMLRVNDGGWVRYILFVDKISCKFLMAHSFHMLSMRMRGTCATSVTLPSAGAHGQS